MNQQKLEVIPVKCNLDEMFLLILWGGGGRFVGRNKRIEMLSLIKLT